MGLLTITVMASKGLSLPPGVTLPASIESVIKAHQPGAAAALASSLGSAKQPHVPGHKSKESIQRKQSWYLPYVVLEVCHTTALMQQRPAGLSPRCPLNSFQFDKNEVLVDALGGDMENPLWMYKAHLCVLFRPSPFNFCVALLTVIYGTAMYLVPLKSPSQLTLERLPLFPVRTEATWATISSSADSSLPLASTPSL